MTDENLVVGRRHVLGTVGGAIAGVSLPSGLAGARGNGPGNGRGNRGGESGLVNAERTDSGAIVATGDNFLISGQELTIDDREFFTADGTTVVIHTDGYTGEIRDNRLVVTEEWASDPTYGISVRDARVHVTGNEVVGDGALRHQFIGIAYSGGATGRIEENTVRNGHRVGILANGDGTAPTIRQNSVVGVGPKSDGWGENGIQISRGATATVQNNDIEELWWDEQSPQSSGVMVFGASNTTIQRNSIRNADAGVALFGGFGLEAGENNNVIHNDIAVTRESAIHHEGVFVMGENNGVRQNDIRAEDGDVGIWVFDGAENTKLIRNRIDGWEQPIVDDGDETKLPLPFDPDA